jgi:hypothetical protein
MISKLDKEPIENNQAESNTGLDSMKLQFADQRNAIAAVALNPHAPVIKEHFMSFHIASIESTNLPRCSFWLLIAYRSYDKVPRGNVEDSHREMLSL